jgi:hypothetical protein
MAADQILLDVLTGDNGATMGQYWDAKYQIYRDFTYGPTYDACKNGVLDKCGQGLGETEATLALLLLPSAAAGTGAKLAAEAEQAAAAERAATAAAERAAEASVVAPRAVGYAEGTAQSALVPERLQHGTRHLVEEGLLPNWSGTKSPGLISDALVPILERPSAAFDSTLGGTAVRAFVGSLNGETVVVFIFKEGPYQGQLATSIVPSAAQRAAWGLK